MNIIDSKSFVADNMDTVTGTRILTADSLGYYLPITYYGDTVTLAERDGLEVPLGSIKSPSSPLALTTGYTYVFNIVEKQFVVTDNLGNITTAENILTWGDLDIEFGIYESHQFIMVLTGAHTYRTIFMYALMRYETYPSYTQGIMWGQFDSYINSIFHWVLPSGAYYGEEIAEQTLPITGTVTFDDIFNTLINDVTRIVYSTLYPNILYYDTTKIVETIADDLKGEIIEFSYGILLALVTNLLYPALLPMQATGETINNRPVYEPWMIMYILNLLIYNIPANGGDPPVGPQPDADNNPYVFSLSPSW